MATNATEGTCRLCLQRRSLRDSHVIPEFVYRPLYVTRGTERYTVGVRLSESGQLRPVKVRKGLRERLLCDDCEGLLNRDFETPSVDLWRTLVDDAPAPTGITLARLTTPQGNTGLGLKGIDYRSFKLFLLSILWRAGVSGRPEYREIRLGKYAERLRQMLLDQSAGALTDIPVLICRLRRPFTGLTSLYPVRDPSGHRVYVGLLTRLKIAYYVSGHVGEDVTKLCIREDGTLHVGEVDLDELPEASDLREIVRDMGDLPKWLERDEQTRTGT